MLSLTFLSLSPHFTISQPSSLFPIQPPKRKSLKETPRSRYNDIDDDDVLVKRSWSSENSPPVYCENSRSCVSFLGDISYSYENSVWEFPASGTPPLTRCVNPSSVARWLRACHNVDEVQRIHAFVRKSLNVSVIYVMNNLICGYLRFGKLGDARKVFDEMPVKNVVTWTAMIDGYLSFDLDDEALRLFLDCVLNGVQANSKMFVCVLNLCCRRVEFELGKQVHACILKGYWRNLIVDSATVHFYAQCDELPSAFCVFDRMARHDVVSWTAMITACSRKGYGREVFSIFSQMLSDGCRPNEYTICGVLKACGEERALRFGRQLHCVIVKKILRNDIFVGTSLLDMYAKCGEIADSRKVFDGMRIRNTVTWTSIITGYAREGLGEEAISLFRVMKRQHMDINRQTIVSILMACGSITASLLGREVHAQIIKNRVHANMYIGSSLVWFYCKCEEYSHAFKVLQYMPVRDVVSWTTIISGCTCLGLEHMSLKLLKKMMEEGIEPNSFTYSSVLKACAKLEAVQQGKVIHSNANKTPAFSNVFVGSALIYLYSKCGHISEAVHVFDSMPERNLVSWKAMIMGYARNGFCAEALKLMYRMQAEGFELDDYIHAMVLTACGDVECNVEHSSLHHLQST